MRPLRRLSAVLVLSAAVAVASAEAPPGPVRGLPKDVALLVPRGSVKVAWVLPPGKPGAAVPEVFDMDADGDPWFGFKGRSIAAPLKGAILVTDEPYQRFAWTDDGALLVTNGRSLGTLAGVRVKGGRKKRVTRTVFKPLLRLPGRDYRPFPGGRGGLFLAGRNESTKLYEVVYVRVKDRVATVRKILESESPVAHVAGGGDTAWVAIGRVVARVDLKKHTLEPVFAHPTEPIREFVHMPNVGFFYATSKGLGFYKKGLQYGFMTGPDLRLRLRGHKLYVLLGRGQGLLRIDGLLKFASLAPKKAAPAP
jgi:hypothetical protein